MSDLGFDLDSIPDPLAAYPQASEPLPALAPPPQVGPTRATLQRRRLLAVFGSIAWLILIQIIIGIRTDLNLTVRLAHVGVPALLGAIALWLALEPGPSGLGPSWRSVIGFTVLSPFAFVAAALVAPCLEDAATLADGIFFCGDFIMAVGVVPMLALTWAQQRSFAAAAKPRSALLGVSVGFTAAGLQALHCAHSDGIHVLIGHSWPVLLMGLIAGLFLHRQMRVA